MKRYSDETKKKKKKQQCISPLGVRPKTADALVPVYSNSTTDSMSLNLDLSTYRSAVARISAPLRAGQVVAANTRPALN